MVGDHLFQRLGQAGAHVCHLLQERRLGHDIQHSFAGRHGERIAAIGAAVHADHHAGGSLFGGQAGTHREAAANALGNRHDIGRDTIKFMGKQLAGARDAALHFVQNQQDAVLVSQIAQAFEKFRAGRADAAFALDRLHHETGHPVVDGGLGCGQIVERDHLEPIRQRFKAFAQLFLIGGGNRRHGATMKGVGKGDHLVPVRIARGIMVGQCGFQRTFKGFGAAVGEEHRIGEGQIDQALGQMFLRRRLVQVRRVHQRGGLLLDRGHQMRVTVAQAVDRDAAGHIQPLAPLRIVKIATVAAHRRHFAAAINGHERADRHRLCSQRGVWVRTPDTQ